jgi:uncharacterized protein YoxC
MDTAPFQIVGCVFSAEPAADRIDAFALQARRERAVVTTRNAHQATFVKFNASDAGLIALACRAALAADGAALRFGFACSTSGSTMQGKDGVRVSNRAIAQAGDLAAGARDGEVLVSTQLASLVMESAAELVSHTIELPGQRTAVACTLASAPPPVPRGAHEAAADRPAEAAATPSVDEIALALQALAAQAEALQRGQADLDARQTAMREQMTNAADRLEQVLRQAAALAQTVEQSQHAFVGLQAQIAQLDAQRQSIDAVQSRADGLTHMLADLQVNLEMLAEQRAVIDEVGEKLARLEFTAQEARNTLRALQRERELAERIEQGLKALRARADAAKAGVER